MSDILKHLSKCVLALLVFAFSLSCIAEIKLEAIFSDHMVLQRDQAVPIWGTAKRGATIQLELNGQRYETLSDENGAWRVTIPDQSAGGPYSLHLSGDGELTLSDVYFGDVWLASGQSNMEWKLDWKIDKHEEIVAAANLPEIRFFEMTNEIATQEISNVKGGPWTLASPKTAGNFSAVAFLFAQKNHLEKGVAVGIIESNWGGTPAEAWVSRDGFKSVPSFNGKLEEIYDETLDWEARLIENEVNRNENYRMITSLDDAIATGAYKNDYATDDWESADLPKEFEHLVWLKREFELGEVTSDIVIEMGDLQQEAFIWLNGTLVTPKQPGGIGSRHTLPTKHLKKGANTITLRVGNSWHNKPYVGRDGTIYLEIDGSKRDISKGWVYSNTVESKVPQFTRYEHSPTFLYNSMIHPLVGYGMRGVIWYQGESNVGRHEEYEGLFQALISDWRRLWNNDFDFLFVQLAGFLPHQDPQPNSAWAALRNSQAQALKLPNTGMATAVDIGDEYDVHPRNKQDVAARLWGEAKRVSFDERLLSRGPTYKKYKKKGNKVTIRFDHTGRKLKLKDGEQVSGFIVGDANGNFYPAKTKLKKKSVVVWSDDVAEPTVIKYGWADTPHLNLYNAVDLPALPFELTL